MNEMIGIERFITTGFERFHVSSDSFCSGGPLGGIPPIQPVRLIPEGGICRVEPIRRRQRCVSCGQMSWRDEVITCPGCQSQTFEDV